MSDLQWTLRVSATDGEAAHVAARRQQFVVGRPLHFDSDYPLMTALECALGALGAEIVNGLSAFAKRRRIVLDQVEAVVKAELDNPLTYLEVVGEEGTPALSRISIKVFADSPHDEWVLKRLWEETRPRLPLVRTLDRAVDLAVEVRLSRS